MSKILYNYQESIGTKAYTAKEIKKILDQHPVKIRYIKTPATNYDLLYYRGKLVRIGAYILACFLGFHRIGWFMMIELEKNAT